MALVRARSTQWSPCGWDRDRRPVDVAQRRSADIPHQGRRVDRLWAEEFASVRRRCVTRRRGGRVAPPVPKLARSGPAT